LNDYVKLGDIVTMRQSAEKHVSRSKALKGHNLPAMGAAHRTNTNYQ